MFSSLKFVDLEFSWSSFSPLDEIGIVILWTFCMLLIYVRYSGILTLSLMISIDDIYIFEAISSLGEN